MPPDPPYLQSPAFQEPHEGPHVVAGWGNELPNRDPSPEQIARMCAAIRATWTDARELAALGRTSKFDRWAQRRRMSEATHVPHGISSRAIGSRDGDLEIYGTPTGGG